MILTAFRLRRDRHTERDSFGYTRSVTGKMREMLPYAPEVGCPIETPLVVKTNLVKMVEHYDRKNGPVVVERLCWMFGTELYPFKARYLHLNKDHITGDSDLLFLQNMKTIHQNLTRNHIVFSSAIQCHFETCIAPWHGIDLRDYVSYLKNRYGDWIGSFAYSRESCWEDAGRFIRMFDEGYAPCQAENFFKEYVIPKPPIRDPFTLNNHASPLSARGLVFEKPLSNPFDTSAPNEIVIDHPEKTLYSPEAGYASIAALEQISLQYSDLSLEYILSGTAFVSCKENYRVSRYRDRKVYDADVDCRWVIFTDVLPALSHEYPDVRFIHDIRVTFLMTYGEEVLIEVFDVYTNECLGAVHFDLAMLALCAPTIAASSDPF